MHIATMGLLQPLPLQLLRISICEQPQIAINPGCRVTYMMGKIKALIGVLAYTTRPGANPRYDFCRHIPVWGDYLHFTHSAALCSFKTRSFRFRNFHRSPHLSTIRGSTPPCPGASRFPNSLTHHCLDGGAQDDRHVRPGV